MESVDNAGPRYSSLKIAGVYAVLGVLWILFSDRLVEALATSEHQLTELQSMKGIGFILISSVAIFFLTYQPLCRLTETNSRLEAALRHSERLHRILRHNLRNSCQAIAGFTDLLVDQSDEPNVQYLERIREHNHRLISLSQKSIYFHDFLDGDPENRVRVDIAEITRNRVAAARETDSDVTIEVECPEHAPAYTHYHIDEAIGELIENAIIHNDSGDTRVWVSLHVLDEDVTLTVADNGPGLPPIERLVLERKTETQTEHSQGLGLWLVYLTIDQSGGTLNITENDHGGTTVELRLPTA